MKVIQDPHKLKLIKESLQDIRDNPLRGNLIRTQEIHNYVKNNSNYYISKKKISKTLYAYDFEKWSESASQRHWQVNSSRIYLD